MFRVVLPLPTFKRRGKYKLLGLNNYRNLHYQVLNKAKQEYKQIVFSELTREHLSQKLTGNLIALYIIYFARKNRKDLPNYGSVVDKFFLDAIVEAGIIRDDKVPYIFGSFAMFGGYGEDKVEIEIGNFKEIVGKLSNEILKNERKILWSI